MKVLDVVDQPTGKVILNLINDDGRPDIDEFDVGEVLLVIVNGLIDLLVIANAVTEIESSNFRVLPLVVRRRCLDFQDVVHDQVFVITY